MSSAPPRTLICTALAVEFNAVRECLRDVNEIKHPAGTIYEIGTFVAPSQIWSIALVQTGAGNPRAAFEVERAIAFFQPSHVLFIGIAGGLKDVKLGDVVAATKVYFYEAGKAETEFRSRPDFGESSYAMAQRAIVVARRRDWVKRIRSWSTDSNTPMPQAFVGPIAAGEEVVASTSSKTYALLKQQFSDALAVEMEAFGFFRAVHANHQVEALVVRGISDLIDAKHDADASGSQERASNHAVAFALEVLATLSTHDILDKHSAPVQDILGNDNEWWRQLLEVAVGLYPLGPNDQYIWSRAGGDVATIDLQAPGRSAWFAALNVLRLGGGGLAITPQRLVQEMQQDYPKNLELQRLMDVRQ